MRYSIYEENMDRLSKKMTRIQNKCRKYGCDFKFEEVGEEFKEVNIDGQKFTGRFVIVEAEGIARVNGWKFIASVEHTKEGNIINKACDIEVPERYYTSKPVCEHCGTNRYRKETYIVMNEETGEFKQVGKSCLKDFTCGMSAEAVAEYTSAFQSLIEGEAPMSGGDHTTYVDTKEFLRYAAETVRHFGYVKESPETRSTKARASQYYGTEHGWYGREMSKDFISEMRKVGFDAESKETADMTEAALEWLAGQEESNNYMHNLKTACALKYNEFKNVGILASLFPTFNRELEREEARKAAEEVEKKSEYVGNIGDRIEVEIADCRCVTSWENQYGWTGIFKITGTDGNVYTWKTGRGIPGNAISLKGTVKDHTEYRGTKQTELTRCKVTTKKEEEPVEAVPYEGSAQEGFDLFWKAVNDDVTDAA